MSKTKNGTRRKIVFGCLGLLLVGGIALGGIVVLNWSRVDSIIFLLSDSEAAEVQPHTALDVLEYLEKYPHESSLVVYSVNGDGTIDTTDTVIVHNADSVVPLASTVKIVLLGGYAQSVVAGEVDPARPVSMAEWERYFLPGTDGGAHIRSLDELGIEHEDGLALDPDQTVTIADLVNAMIHYSDNAATDFIFNEVGEDSVQRFVDDAGLEGQGPFFNFSAHNLSCWNHEEGPLSGRRAADLVAMSPADYRQEMERWDELMADQDWRRAEQQWLGDGPQFAGLREQYVVGQLLPSGTANDYALMMAGVATNRLISTEVSTLMRGYLDWPMQSEAIKTQFANFGTKGGSVAGILTEASYMVPREGDFSGRPRVVVLFLNKVPAVPWMAMLKSFAPQPFMRQLATDSEFVDETANVLGIEP